MLHPSNGTSWSSVPQSVSLREYLLASHLVRERDMTWRYLSLQYPRSFTEICSDQARSLLNGCTRWLRRHHQLLIALFRQLVVTVAMILVGLIAWSMTA